MSEIPTPFSVVLDITSLSSAIRNRMSLPSSSTRRWMGNVRTQRAHEADRESKR